MPQTYLSQMAAVADFIKMKTIENAGLVNAANSLLRSY